LKNLCLNEETGKRSESSAFPVPKSLIMKKHRLYGASHILP